MSKKRKITTIVEILSILGEEYEDNPTFLNYRKGISSEWISNSTREFLKKVWYIAIALQSKGLKKKSIGLLSDSCSDWNIVDFGILLSGCYTVPLFSNMSDENLLFEINDCGMDVLYVSSEEKWRALQPHNHLFKLVIVNGIQNSSKNSTVISLEDLLDIGQQESTHGDSRSMKQLIEVIKPEELATIVYTSGTTGIPKGVPLTHKNIAHQVNACCEVYGYLESRKKAVVCLPLAHIFQRTVSLYQLRSNLSNYFVDDIKNLAHVLQEVKPGFLTVVPRILEKVYNRILEKILSSSGITRILSGLAFKRARTRNPHSWIRWPWDFLYDALVYSKLRKIFGGNLELCSCGGAALPLEMHRFFLNIGLPLFQGYGLTETSPVLAANFLKKNRVGTVGTLYPEVQIKLSEEGEILAKGPNVMCGYYNNEAITKEVFTTDGWFKTGDLGKIDADGFLRIVGKNKEMFKTTHGKYVVATTIENALKKSLLVDIAMIIADGRPYVSAILFLNREKVPGYKERYNIFCEDDVGFLQHPKIREYFDEYISVVNAGLNEWEKVRKYRITLDLLTVESGDLTPKMSLRRSQIERKYEVLVGGMY